MSRYENPLHCPECGEILCMWIDSSRQWQCIKCDWLGRKPVKKGNSE